MAHLGEEIDLDPAKIKAGLKGSRRLARDRLLAGWMLLQRLGKGVRPSGAAPPARRPSIEALAERALRWAGENRADNLVKRLWSPSRPVLHLAAAFQVMAAKAGLEEGKVGDATLDDPALNEQIVTLAGEIEELVLGDDTFSAWSSSMIRINLIKIAD